MSHPVNGVDHVFLLVNDLEKSAEQYRRFGFTLSPRGLHSKEKGTGNYTIMFPDDYFELLGIVSETDGNLNQREKLAAQGEGLHAIACRIASASDAKKELTELGLKTGDVGAFSRPVELPGGGEGVAAFETVSFADSGVPQGMVFMCQHKTHETVWLPELIKHANGANGLAAIIAISDQPEATAEGFARLFSAGTANQEDGHWQVYTGPRSAAIIVYDREAAESIYGKAVVNSTPQGAFASLRVQVTALSKTRAALDGNNITYTTTSNGIIIAPVDGSGTILEFSEA